jgi:hypothetical protein
VSSTIKRIIFLLLWRGVRGGEGGSNRPGGGGREVRSPPLWGGLSLPPYPPAKRLRPRPTPGRVWLSLGSPHQNPPPQPEPRRQPPHGTCEGEVGRRSIW